MLSDHDRQILRELEGRLAAQDPEFARRFAAAPPPRRATPSPAGLLQIAGALVFAGLMLLAGSMAGALVFVAVAAGIGLARRHAGGPGHHQPHGLA